MRVERTSIRDIELPRTGKRGRLIHLWKVLKWKSGELHSECWDDFQWKKNAVNHPSSTASPLPAHVRTGSYINGGAFHAFWSKRRAREYKLENQTVRSVYCLPKDVIATGAGKHITCRRLYLGRERDALKALLKRG